MFTTAGAVALAMFLNVVASMDPDSGALLVAGTETVCADDEGVRSIFDVITTVTAMEAMAIRTA
jgi:hypothetical protein